MPTNPNNRYVVRDGKEWAVKKAGAQRASSKHGTQAEAVAAAKEIVRNAGGGEVPIQGRSGRFRNSDTVAPGNDPFPPRDKR